MTLSLMPWNSVAFASDESYEPSSSVVVVEPVIEPVVPEVPTVEPAASSGLTGDTEPAVASPRESTPGAGSPEEPSKTSKVAVFVAGAVSGRVVDSAGQGLGGIVVRVQDIGADRLVMAEMTTSSDGEFVLGDVPAGVYKLAMVDPTWRYVSGYLGGSSFESASDVFVAAAGTTGVGDVDMAAWCYASGDLYDWTGDVPVFGATVRAYAQAGDEWVVRASTKTADNGGWSVRVPEGVYRIGYENPVDASATYHPAADALVSAQDVIVTRAGVWLSARLLSPSVQLSGSAVSQADGAGVQGMKIDLTPVGGGAGITATTDEYGVFAADVVPGSYVYEASFPDGGYAFASGLTVATVGTGAVAVGPEGASLQLVVVPVAVVKGTVSDKVTGSPIAQAEVELVLASDASLRPQAVSAVTGSDGSFEIKSLPYSGYTVRALVPDSDVDWYLGDVRSIHDATWFDVTSSHDITVEVRVSDDGTAPTTQLDYDGGRLLAPATVAMIATDEGVGVAATYWRVGSGAWNSGNAIRLDHAGTVVVEYYSVDRVGNREMVQSAVLDVAGIAGVPTEDAPAAGPVAGSGNPSDGTGESSPATPLEDHAVSSSAGAYAFSSTQAPGLLTSPRMGRSPEMSPAPRRLPSLDWVALWWPTDTSVALWAAVFAMFGAAAALTLRLPQTAAAYARGHGHVFQLSDFRVHD